MLLSAVGSEDELYSTSQHLRQCLKLLSNDAEQMLTVMSTGFASLKLDLNFE